MKKALLRLVSLGLVVILCGCATSKEWVNKTEEFVNKTLGRASCDLRKPGLFQVEKTDETMKKYGCSYGDKMKFYLLESSLNPYQVTRANDLCHRITFALCPSEPAQTYKAMIKRTVIYKGEELTTFSSHKELDPGTWDMDVKIPVPANARSGIYAVKTVIYIGDKAHEKVDEFKVLFNK
jgi:hypothetical protein